MTRVLLVENDTDLASLLVRVITNAGASRLDVAPDVDQALLRATFNDYDIVVADFDLGPEAGGGVDALDRLRRERLGPGTYVVISSVTREVPQWCTLVEAGDLTRLATLISAQA